MSVTNKIEKENLDPIRVLSTADSFYKAAQRCGEMRIIDQNRVEMLIVPEITNNAFACELFLKSILIKQGKPSSGHDLCSLWDKLPTDAQAQVKQTCINNSSVTFEESLVKIKLVFKEWRYLYEYENGQVDKEFLNHFATALKDLAHKLVETTTKTVP